MVKIVGKDPQAVHRTTCGNCASVLEYTKSEVFTIKHSYDWTGDYCTDPGFKCPNCGANVFV